MRARAAAILTAVTALLVRAAPVLACPVCMNATSQRVLYTYFVTAAVMTLVALALVATIAIWLYRQFDRADARLSEGEL